MSDDTLPDPDSEPFWQGAAAGELRYHLVHEEDDYPVTESLTIGRAGDCDIIVERWQNFTGQKAERIEAE